MQNSSRRIRLVTFDAMKTLITPREAVGKIYADFAARKFQLRFDADSLNKSFLHNYRLQDQQNPCFGYYSCENSSSSSLAERQKFWWINVVKGTFSNVKSIDESQLNALSSDLYDFFGTVDPWRLNSSAKSILDFLTGKGISVAVLSNFDSRLRRILSQFGLDRYFRAFFLSGETGLAKPNEKLFKLVEKTMIVDSNEIAHIGDDFEKDYLAAKNSGWRPFLFSESSVDDRADKNHILTNLCDLKSKIF